VSALLPPGARGGLPEPEHPRLQERPLSDRERRARWEVRAAQWRARALAEARAGGALRGLLRLQVPFDDIHRHREREASFLAAVEADPVLASVRLVYVIGPEPV
jgi:hypothetical protein